MTATWDRAVTAERLAVQWADAAIGGTDTDLDTITEQITRLGTAAVPVALNAAAGWLADLWGPLLGKDTVMGAVRRIVASAHRIEGDTP